MLLPQLQSHNNRDGENHEEDVGDDVDGGVDVVELGWFIARGVKVRAVVPSASHGGAME